MIQTLFADRVLDNLRAAQGVVGLGKKYGPVRLESACQRALHFENPRYKTVKTILEKGLDQTSVPGDTVPLSSVYTGSGRFLRQSGVMRLH